MVLHQEFRFEFESQERVASFLRGLGGAVLVDDRGDFFVYRQLPGQDEFEFDCAIIPTGLLSNRSGQYFEFVGLFVEALTGEFGAVTVEDA